MMDEVRDWAERSLNSKVLSANTTTAALKRRKIVEKLLNLWGTYVSVAIISECVALAGGCNEAAVRAAKSSYCRYNHHNHPSRTKAML